MLEDPYKNGNQVLLFARAFGFWNQTKNPKKCFGPIRLSQNGNIFQIWVAKQPQSVDYHEKNNSNSLFLDSKKKVSIEVVHDSKKIQHDSDDVNSESDSGVGSVRTTGTEGDSAIESGKESIKKPQVKTISAKGKIFQSIRSFEVDQSQMRSFCRLF